MSERITTNHEQCGGRPCIRGMRIRVVDVLELLAAGLTFAEVLDELLIWKWLICKPYIERRTQANFDNGIAASYCSTSNRRENSRNSRCVAACSTHLRRENQHGKKEAQAKTTCVQKAATK